MDRTTHSGILGLAIVGFSFLFSLIGLVLGVGGWIVMVLAGWKYLHEKRTESCAVFRQLSSSGSFIDA